MTTVLVVTCDHCSVMQQDLFQQIYNDTVAAKTTRTVLKAFIATTMYMHAAFVITLSIASATPDLRLPSRPQSITALWPVPNCTAW